MGPVGNSRCIRLVSISVLALILALAGCGSSNSFSNGNTSTTPPASAGTGSSTGTPSATGGSTGGGGGISPSTSIDALAACGTISNTESRITGRVIDASTGQPIAGRAFVDVDLAQGAWLNALQADATGHFQSDKLLVGKQNFTLVFFAVAASGTQYVPKILTSTNSCPITQGTDIGTIALTPGTSAQGTALVSGQTSAGTPAPIKETPQALYVSYAGTDWALSLYPYLAQSQDLQTGGSCPAGTSCATVTLPVAASPAVAAMYNGPATQFLPVSSTAAYVLGVIWGNSSSSSFSSHCLPAEVRSGTVSVSPGATANFGTLNFASC